MLRLEKLRYSQVNSLEKFRVIWWMTRESQCNTCQQNTTCTPISLFEFVKSVNGIQFNSLINYIFVSSIKFPKSCIWKSCFTCVYTGPHFLLVSLNFTQKTFDSFHSLTLCFLLFIEISFITMSHMLNSIFVGFIFVGRCLTACWSITVMFVW